MNLTPENEITLTTVDKLVQKLQLTSTKFKFWKSPLVNSDTLNQEICLEWWNNERKYTVYVKDYLINYFAVVRGLVIREGTLNINDRQELANFWRWISYE